MGDGTGGSAEGKGGVGVRCTSEETVVSYHNVPSRVVRTYFSLVIPNTCSKNKTYSPVTGGSSDEGGVAPRGAPDMTVGDGTGGSAKGREGVGEGSRARKLG